MFSTADPMTWYLAVLEGGMLIAIGLAALRDPTLWPMLFDEMEAAPSMRLTAGSIGTVFGGLALWLGGGWSDPLAFAVSAFALAALAKGLALLLAGRAYLRLARPMLPYVRGWAIFATLAGAALAAAGILAMFN